MGVESSITKTLRAIPILIAERNGSNPKQIFIESLDSIATIRPGHAIAASSILFGALPQTRWTFGGFLAGRWAATHLTHHNSRVAYPTLLDDRTLIYTAPAEDGSGVWLYATDVERRIPHRVSFGVEHYLSVSASSNGRRLAATVANSSGNLWTVPILEGIAEESAARRFALPNVRVIVPRFGPNYLLYLSARGVPTESGNSRAASLPNYGKRVRARFRRRPPSRPMAARFVFLFISRAKAASLDD